MTDDSTMGAATDERELATDDRTMQWMETGRLAELGRRSAELIHELRQPVFSAKALVEMMRQTDPDNASLAKVEVQLRHMQSLLDRYAVSGRRPRGCREPLHLQAIIETTAETMRARARIRQRRLKVEAAGPASAIYADPIGVRQIAINLIGNALDAARNQVTVTVEGSLLIVGDDGPGVPPEVASRIFDPFFTTKPPERGTGLGLAITRRLAEESGSVLEWDSSAAGTEFRVRFPLLETGIHAAPGPK